jgi:hypothetical protein
MGPDRTAGTLDREGSRLAHLLAAGTTRLLLFLAVGGVTFVFIQLVQLVGEAAGLCTRCNVGSEGGVLWAVAAGGGAAAGAGSDDIFAEDYFEKLFDKAFGTEPPEPSIEGVPLPADPAFDGPADVEAIRGSGFYEQVVDDNSTLNELGRSVRRMFGAEVRDPQPETPLPESPPMPRPPEPPGR